MRTGRLRKGIDRALGQIFQRPILASPRTHVRYGTRAATRRVFERAARQRKNRTFKNAR